MYSELTTLSVVEFEEEIWMEFSTHHIFDYNSTTVVKINLKIFSGLIV